LDVGWLAKSRGAVTQIIRKYDEKSKTKSPTGEGGAWVLLTSVETVKRLSADE
jgi:hypothetical protein